ncbi:hypothetical protein [Bacillus sp. FJAT-52991]|uniref:Uncharacterized protein n=1 Tax=Bacillus kandeliae TaxID=3129297 RepID=A0ABZ2N357_9BACI
MDFKNIAAQLTVAAVKRMDLESQDRDAVIKEVFATYNDFLNLLEERDARVPNIRDYSDD